MVHFFCRYHISGCIRQILCQGFSSSYHHTLHWHHALSDGERRHCSNNLYVDAVRHTIRAAKWRRAKRPKPPRRRAPPNHPILSNTSGADCKCTLLADYNNKRQTGARRTLHKQTRAAERSMYAEHQNTQKASASCQKRSCSGTSKRIDGHLQREMSARIAQRHAHRHARRPRA